MRQRAALIGYGAVGRELVELVRDGAAGHTEILAILEIDPDRFSEDSLLVRIPFVGEVSEVIGMHPDVVVEAAGHEAFRAHVPRLLEAGIEVLALSVGALADPGLLETVRTAADRGHTRLRIASGAIAGLDAISSAAVGRIDRVTHTVRKPPHGLLPADEADAVLRSGQPRQLYAGSAREGVVRFPANVNVVAAVSLAGIGFDRTETRVIADPAVERNTHEVEVSGTFGCLTVRIENIPGPNPKTGRIVPLSLARALRARGELVVAGA